MFFLLRPRDHIDRVPAAILRPPYREDHQDAAGIKRRKMAKFRWESFPSAKGNPPGPGSIGLEAAPPTH
jgi:hypothetical protein